MKVLIAVEDKVYGAAIASFVGKHKWQPGTEFKVIHVVETTDSVVGLAGSFCCDANRELTEERQRRDRAMVQGVATSIQTQLNGVPVEEEILSGRPKEVILDEAESWPADIIILGSHGRNGFGRFLLGSVSLAVLSKAVCSVMIVKLPHGTDEKSNEAKKETAQKSSSAEKNEDKKPAMTTKK